jgi:di/tricarboxylate transporter
LQIDQIVLFVILGGVFVLLIWGRWRYDLVAFVALMTALVAGVVPAERAFSGFGHPATAVIALVLIISRGLSNSGAIELLARFFVDPARSLGRHIAAMSGFAAGLSAVMNNVAALALLMPLDMQAADAARRSRSLTLMPLSFASILGGMITLIGTPPNIVIAGYRADALGAPYQMFDFAPVGLACAGVGILFITLVGWRLIPRRQEAETGAQPFDVGQYLAEVKVPDDSKLIGRRVRDLDEEAERADVEIVGLIRRGQRLPGLARRIEIRAGDILVLEAHPDRIDAALGAFQLEYVPAGSSALVEENLGLLETVVPESSRLVGRSAASIRLLYRYGVALVGVSRGGQRFRERVRRLEIRPGDVLLLLGPEDRLADIAARLGLLPLQDRGQRVVQRHRAGLAAALFAGGILLATFGFVPLHVALGVVAALFVITNIVPLRELYTAVEWPVIVLLGSMIPLGEALEASGGTALIAEAILGLSAGASPVLVLTLLIVATMTLSDVMNNTATAVIAAPIALELAHRLGVNPDAFLMGVAVAASCAFLTPIGHKNNTLILGPGGYRFGDYWRMGLPLEILIVAVSVPMLLWVWPL